LGLERNAVGFPALITNYLKAFSVSAPGSRAAAARVRAARVAAGLAAFGMAQSALAIIILLSLSKGKAGSAIGTSNFQIRHDQSPEKRQFLRVYFAGREVYSTDAGVYRILKGQ
jgi:hypothetical protein